MHSLDCSVFRMIALLVFSEAQRCIHWGRDLIHSVDLESKNSFDVFLPSQHFTSHKNKGKNASSDRSLPGYVLPRHVPGLEGTEAHAACPNPIPLPVCVQRPLTPKGETYGAIGQFMVGAWVLSFWSRGSDAVGRIQGELHC